MNDGHGQFTYREDKLILYFLNKKKMKKIILVVTTLLLLLFSCTDLTDIENRLSDLESRVDVIEQISLPEVVLNIEKMRGKINEDDSTYSSIAALQDRILEIDDELKSGDADIFWGDVMSDTQFDTFVKGNYSKITGKVEVTSNEQVAFLQNVTFVGSDLTLSGITGVLAFENLEVVSGSLYIENILSEDTLDLSFPELVGVSLDVETNVNNAFNLRSLYMPELVVVGGDFLLDFPTSSLGRTNSFSSLDISKLSIVGNTFKLKYTEDLEELHLATVFIGGDFILSNNQNLCLGHSDINSIERIEGSILLSDNFIQHNGQVELEYLSEVNLFPNLTYVGQDISYSGSEDLYRFSGFGALKEVYGDLYCGAGILGFGLDTDVKFFNSLETVEGDFSISVTFPETTLDQEDNTTVIYGFDALTHVDGNFRVAADEIYGFENLEHVGNSIIDSCFFDIDADFAPQFAKLVMVDGIKSTVNLRIAKTRIDDMFPVFGEDQSFLQMFKVRLRIDLSNDDYMQTINGGFSSMQHIGSLTIDPSFYLDDELFKIENGAFESLEIIGTAGVAEHGLDIEVTSEVDLSSFKNYFIAKAEDYKTANDNYVTDSLDYDELMVLFISDSIQYQMDYTEYMSDTANFEKPTPDYQRPSLPELIYTQSPNVNIHSIALRNTDNAVDHYTYTDNYAEIKEDPESDIPALIQCFMKYGKLTAADLNY